MILSATEVTLNCGIIPSDLFSLSTFWRLSFLRFYTGEYRGDDTGFDFPHQDSAGPSFTQQVYESMTGEPETTDVGPDMANPGTSIIGNSPFRWRMRELNDSEFVPPLIASSLLALLEKLQETNVQTKTREVDSIVGGKSFFVACRLSTLSVLPMPSFVRFFNGGLRRSWSIRRYLHG